jgi:hypothetical protein
MVYVRLLTCVVILYLILKYEYSSTSKTDEKPKNITRYKRGISLQEPWLLGIQSSAK